VCDVETLLAEASCFQCLPAGQQQLIELSLLCQIATNGGGGGGGSDFNSDGVIDPVAAPTDPTKTNLYTNTAAGTLWIWPAGGAAWQQIV